MTRVCLKCQRDFESVSNGNRICGVCKKNQKDVGNPHTTVTGVRRKPKHSEYNETEIKIDYEWVPPNRRE